MKEQIIAIVKEELKKENYIEFAYIFGSFISGEKYSDIDIGVYISPPNDENDFKVTSELKHKISRKLIKANIPAKADDIDIVVLNLIDFKFLNRIFKEGLIIMDRNYDFRTSLIEKNSIKMRECVGILKEAEIL